MVDVFFVCSSEKCWKNVQFYDVETTLETKIVWFSAQKKCHVAEMA